jgi:hypothetical protein
MKLTMLSLPRLPTLILLCAVLVGRMGLFIHELEHAVEGEEESCLICLMVDHQVPLADTQEPILPSFLLVSVNHTHLTSIQSNTRVVYTARAPPAV